MDKTEIEARISALEYILENNFYEGDTEQDILQEANQLRKLLKEPEGILNGPEQAIIKERQESYGDYDTFIADMVKILNILADRKNSCKYTEKDIENFFFVLKLLRHQTAKDLDSVFDLARYADLAYERLKDVRDNS